MVVATEVDLLRWNLGVGAEGKAVWVSVVVSQRVMGGWRIVILTRPGPCTELLEPCRRWCGVVESGDGWVCVMSCVVLLLMGV